MRIWVSASGTRSNRAIVTDSADRAWHRKLFGHTMADVGGVHDDIARVEGYAFHSNGSRASRERLAAGG